MIPSCLKKLKNRGFERYERYSQLVFCINTDYIMAAVMVHC